MWPYGGTRTGGITQTAKLSTGQQQEPEDAALGLYNYKARFYSTTLGRFVSADPLTRDSLNRYSYVLNNPLAYVDPTGLSAGIICGWGQDCENGEIDPFRDHIIAYWMSEGISFGPYSFDSAYGMLKWVLMNQGWDATATLQAFEVGFVNTDPKKVIHDPATEWDEGDTDNWARAADRLVRFNPSVDFLIGYSLGGRAIARWLMDQANNIRQGNANVWIGIQVKSVLLIHPFMNCSCFAPGSPVTNIGPIELYADQLPGVRVVIRNDRMDRVAWGTVHGGINLESHGACTGFLHHCTSGSTATLDVSLARCKVGGRSVTFAGC
jgi:RHS repeat-associated protein